MLFFSLLELQSAHHQIAITKQGLQYAAFEARGFTSSVGYHLESQMVLLAFSVLSTESSTAKTQQGLLPASITSLYGE